MRVDQVGVQATVTELSNGIAKWARDGLLECCNEVVQIQECLGIPDPLLDLEIDRVARQRCSLQEGADARQHDHCLDVQVQSNDGRFEMMRHEQRGVRIQRGLVQHDVEWLCSGRAVVSLTVGESDFLPPQSAQRLACEELTDVSEGHTGRSELMSSIDMAGLQPEHALIQTLAYRRVRLTAIRVPKLSIHCFTHSHM